MAAPEDVALVADTDEIARPEAVRMLKRCYPFGASGEEPGMLVLQARAFHYGVHCRGATVWEFGPHAFSVAFLNRTFQRASLPYALPAGQSAADERLDAGRRTPPGPGNAATPVSRSHLALLAQTFSGTRHAYTYFSRPTLVDAAWHLSCA